MDIDQEEVQLFIIVKRFMSYTHIKLFTLRIYLYPKKVMYVQTEFNMGKVKKKLYPL